MTKHIHTYINSDSKITGANNVSIEQISSVPNGSCDVLSFNELNTTNATELDPIVGGLSRKIKINSGIMCLEFINFDKVYNDIGYNKISIEDVNKTLSNKKCFFFEKDLSDILSRHNLSIKQVIYDGYSTKITIQRTQ